jgi:aspartyl-tRNA synthetase
MLERKNDAGRSTKVADLAKFAGERVELQAWVQKVRDQKRVQFVILRDASGMAQAVHEKIEGAPLGGLISSLHEQSVVRVVGRVVVDDRVKLGGLEIQIEHLEPMSMAAPQLPITPDSSPSKRQAWRFIEMRHPKVRAVFEVQTAIEGAMRKQWIADDFLEIHTPKLMGTASESGAEVFKVDYFDQPAFLAQSPQFYKQMAMAAGLDRVFEIGPVFRAEPSFTTIHATEFISVDVELAWIDGVEDVMAYEERWLTAVLGELKRSHGDLIVDTFGIEPPDPRPPFPRVTMRNARELVRELGGTVPAKEDLDPESQRLLANYFAETEGAELFFVTEYPVEVRPFYHMLAAPGADVTRSFDLIWRGIEITTGAQREHRLEVLHAQAETKRMDPAELDFYFDFFRYGCPPHGGFGFGLARMMMVLLGLPNIRDVTFLNRTPSRLTP